MSTVRWDERAPTGIWPRTVAGWWSVAFSAVFLLGAVALFAAAASGQTGGEAILDNLWLGIPGIVGLAGAAASAITGLVAMIGRHERSAAVVTTTTVSAAALVFVALSVLFG